MDGSFGRSSGASSSQELSAANPGSSQQTRPTYDKAKEKAVRDTIARLTASAKSFPRDEDCSPQLLIIEQQLVAQLEAERDTLRAMKPLAVRVQRTEVFVDKTNECLAKVEEELVRLTKEKRTSRPRSHTT